MSEADNAKPMHERLLDSLSSYKDYEKGATTVVSDMICDLITQKTKGIGISIAELLAHVAWVEKATKKKPEIQFVHDMLPGIAKTASVAYTELVDILIRVENPDMKAPDVAYVTYTNWVTSLLNTAVALVAAAAKNDGNGPSMIEGDAYAFLNSFFRLVGKSGGSISRSDASAALQKLLRSWKTGRTVTYEDVIGRDKDLKQVKVEPVDKVYFDAIDTIIDTLKEFDGTPAKSTDASEAPSNEMPINAQNDSNAQSNVGVATSQKTVVTEIKSTVKIEQKQGSESDQTLRRAYQTALSARDEGMQNKNLLPRERARLIRTVEYTHDNYARVASRTQLASASQPSDEGKEPK